MKNVNEKSDKLKDQSVSVRAKSCALVCGATFAQDDFCARYERGEFAHVVAVDSGYAHLTHVGVPPDVALGDFDSLGFVPERGISHPAIKDKSDLELALDYVRAEGFRDIWVYGCLGGRIDHTISALQVLRAAAERSQDGRSAPWMRGSNTQDISESKNASAQKRDISQTKDDYVRIRAVSGEGALFNHANSRRQYSEILEVLTAPRCLKLTAHASAKPERVSALGAPTYGCVSLLAATSEVSGVSTRGLFYALNDAKLDNRASLGLSNELVERTGYVSAKSGTLFVVYPSTLKNECIIANTGEL